VVENRDLRCLPRDQTVPVGLIRAEKLLAFCESVMIAIFEPCKKEFDPILDVF
jgi:hypothetical protein